MQGRIAYGAGDLDAIGQENAAWQTLGASHVSINTMGSGFESVDDHIAAIARAATVLVDVR